MNNRIERILTDLVVSLVYLPDVMREAPSSVVPRKASSYGLGHPWGAQPMWSTVGIRGYTPHS